MNNGNIINNFHKSIIKECETRLDREVTNIERSFIMSRESLIALEMIEDTVKSIKSKELEEYLNSEDNEKNKNF